VVCGGAHQLDNDRERATVELERLFAQLMQPELGELRAALDASRGKMIGVLVAETSDGKPQPQILRAYSGELGGRRDWPDFVGSVLRREDTAELEVVTLRRIAELEQQMAALDVEGAQRHLDDTRRQIRLRTAERRQTYQLDRREHGPDPDAARLRGEARVTDDAEVAAALAALLDERAKLASLRKLRRATSLTLSRAMYDVATVTNARGVRRRLREIFAGPRGAIAAGTTDCVAPKLLEAANVAGLRPLALAEAWWGPTMNGRQHGHLQPPCDQKCKPVLGYLLCDHL